MRGSLSFFSKYTARYLHAQNRFESVVLDYLALEYATDEVLGGKRYNNSYTKH